jgi:hypothetical protein
MRVWRNIFARKTWSSYAPRNSFSNAPICANASRRTRRLQMPGIVPPSFSSAIVSSAGGSAIVSGASPTSP